MNHTRGFRKKYFTLAAITAYSTLNKLTTIENTYKEAKDSLEYVHPNKAPPVK
ncbi:MAG: hypothetical protein OIF32_07905 [Campylobacterales bacterium]|nr:hypothetical protein [Campylobacterales bacterium]